MINLTAYKNKYDSSQITKDICELLCGFFATVLLLIYGSLKSNYNAMLWSVLLLFLANIIFGLKKRHERILFIIFHICFFTFLLTRPFISMCKGSEWWYLGDSAARFSINILYISLLFLRIGFIIIEEINRSSNLKKAKIMEDLNPKKEDASFLKTLRVVSLMLYLFSMIFYLAIQVEKLIFMNGREYADIYIYYESSLPGFVNSLSTLMPFALRLYLATLPKKRSAFFALLLYVISAIPMLIIGTRNVIVLNILFAFIYYIFRDIIKPKNEKKWIGKKEITCVIIGLPIALLFLGAYNYIRDGQDVSLSILNLIVDFFYKQGVSFDVLGKAYLALPKMEHIVYQNFTFGPFIDYFTRSGLGTKLFQSIDLGTQNSSYLALFGNSFSHSMSYVAHPEYLSGHGWGSSFLLELFADWGYIGVIIGSTIFGILLKFIVDMFKEGSLLRTISLTVVAGLMFSPRDSATGWLLNIVTVGFWFTVIFCYLVAGIFKKKYIFSKGRINNMFDQCGFKDIIYALWKKKILVIVITIACFICGFAGEKIISSNDINNLVVDKQYETSAYYQVVDNTEKDTDLSIQYANTTFELARTDFAASEILQELKGKYTNEEIIKYLNLGNENDADALSSADIIESLSGSVVASTPIVNIKVSSSDKEFSEYFLNAYKDVYEKYATTVSDCEVSFINETSVKNESVTNNKYDLSLSNLALILTILGFLISCLFIILKAFFRPTINRQADFELFNIDVIGEFNFKKGEQDE